MDPVTFALQLTVAATDLIQEIYRFNARIRGRPALLDRLTNICTAVTNKVETIDDQLARQDPLTVRNEMPWRNLTDTLLEMRRVVEAYKLELRGLLSATASNALERAIRQLSTDNAMCRINQFEADINRLTQDMLFYLTVALHQRANSVSYPLGAQDDQPVRRPSQETPRRDSGISMSGMSGSTIMSSTMSEIEKATSKLDIEKVRLLLRGDPKLVYTVDDIGRTLIDLAVSRTTSNRSQVSLVRLLRKKGAKFTRTNDHDFYKLYNEIEAEINLHEQHRIKKSK